eukprot:TRINITY_DN5264_c0_g1_i1.p1 TRINITY_DN5264_c0_g1~~TRINITY_DN5264_c0_g1_i1.p1  ORF type:complete len:566 (+),score=134.92 TRINITY_DN5264_c0_g1_i1:170-1867(+)
MDQCDPLDEQIERVLASKHALEAEQQRSSSGVVDLENDDVRMYWARKAARFQRDLKQFGPNTAVQKLNFVKHWESFSDDNSIAKLRWPPSVSQSCDLFSLYKKVVSLGGFENVSTMNLWEKVAIQFDTSSSDKTAAYLLQTFYFQHLFHFEQAYQNPLFFKQEECATMDPTCVPRNPFANVKNLLKNVKNVNSVYTGNYYEGPGLFSAVFTSLISGAEDEVVWALNELLLVSHNADKPFKLEDFPQLLDALLHLMREYAFSQLGIKTTASGDSLNLFKMLKDMEEKKTMWPDLSVPILTILANFSENPKNQRVIVTHQLCMRLVCILASNENIPSEVRFLVGEILCNVAHLIDLSSSPQWTNYITLWLEKCLTSRNTNQERQALKSFALLGNRPVNQQAFSSAFQLSIYHNLLVFINNLIDASDRSLEGIRRVKNLIMALQAIYHLFKGGEKIRLRLCRETDCLKRLCSVLSFGVRDTLDTPHEFDEEVEELKRRVRRTSAAAVGLLYEVKDNQRAFEDFEGEIFEACAAHYEVAHFLAPLLLVLPALEAPVSSSSGQQAASSQQ